MEPLTDEMKEKMIESINKKIKEQRKILRDLPAMERNRADGKAQKRVKSANYRGEADKSHQAIENLQNKLKFIDSYEDEIKAAKSDAERESINARMQGIIQQEYYGISPRAVKLAAEKAKKQEAQQENVSKGISDDARNNLINNVNNFINQTDLTEEEKANLRSFYTDYASNVMDEEDISILRAELNDSINEMRERRNIENQVNDEQEENKIIDDEQKESQPESPFANISNDDISMYMQAIEGRYNLAFDRLKGKSGQELNDNLALANNLNSLKNQLLDFEKNAKNANTPEEIAKYEVILDKAKRQYEKYQNELNELQRQSEEEKTKGKSPEGATEGVVKAEAEEERISILCDATYGIYKVSGKDITLNSNNKDVIRENRKLKKEIRTSYGLSRADMKHLDLNAYRLLNKASKDQAEEYINSIKNRDNSEYKSDRKFDLVYDFRENDLESFKDIGKKTNFFKKWALKRLASRGEEMGVAKVADTMYLSEGLDYDKYLKENSPEEKKFSKEEKNKEKNLINDLQDYTYSIEEAEITAAQMEDFVIDPKNIKDFAINPEDIENMKHQDTKGEDDTAPVM